MTKDEMKALGIVQKAGRKGTRFLLKTKDLSGKERYTTLKITDKSSKKEISAEIQKARIKLKKDTTSIKKLIDVWHLEKNHSYSTKRNANFFLKNLTLDPDGDRDVVIGIMESDNKISTKHAKISMIHSFYRWLKESGYPYKDPTKNIKISHPNIPRSRVATDSEVKFLIKNTKNDHDCRLLLLLLLHTGCRVSTAESVTPQSIQNNKLTLYNKKCDRYYTIPIYNTDLIECIKIGYKSSPHKAYYRLCKKMYTIPPDVHGERLSPHSLRHTWATRAIQAGITLDVISKILDHSSIATTLRVYARHSTAQLTEAIQTVSDTIAQKG